MEDDVTDNPRTVTNVTSSLSLTAEFQLKTYSVEFVAGTGGSISGLTPQSVTHGFDASEVEAVASEGYEFVKWSDDVTDNPRTITDIQSNLIFDSRVSVKDLLRSLLLVSVDQFLEALRNQLFTI